MKVKYLTLILALFLILPMVNAVVTLKNNYTYPPSGNDPLNAVGYTISNSFQATSSYALNVITLNCSKTATPNNAQVFIRAATADGRPTGPILSSGINATAGWGAGFAKRNFTMSALSITSSRYVILMNSSSQSTVNYITCALKDPKTYIYGNRSYRLTTTDTWVLSGTSAGWFQVWGSTTNNTVSTIPILSTITPSIASKYSNLSTSVTNYGGNIATINYTWRVNSTTGAKIKSGYNASGAYMECFNYTNCKPGITVYVTAQAFNKTTSPDSNDKSTNSTAQTRAIYALQTSTTKTLTGANLVGVTLTAKLGANTTTRTNATGNKSYFYLGVGVWNITASKLGYVSVEKNVTIGTTTRTENETFNLPLTNSVYIIIKNERTGTAITENVTATSTYSSGQFLNYTSNGTLYLTNLVAANYSMSFASTSYPTRSYSVAVGSGTFQYLNVYLLNSSTQVTFTTVDADSLQPLENATIIISRIINSTWTTVAVLMTDITGSAAIKYDPTTQYKVYTTKANYQDKLFTVNPFLSSTYQIGLFKLTPFTDNSNFAGITMSYTPHQFFNYSENNFTILFASPNGYFSNYEFNLSYPSSTYSASGANAYGATFNKVFNCSTSTTAFVKLNVSYLLTNLTRKFYSYSYLCILSTTYQTIYKNKDNTYGLGVLERMFIAILLIIVIAGFVALYAGVFPATLTAMLMLGFFTYIGFVDSWLGYISLIMGFVYIIWGSSR